MRVTRDLWSDTGPCDLLGVPPCPQIIFCYACVRKEAYICVVLHNIVNLRGYPQVDLGSYYISNTINRIIIIIIDMYVSMYWALEAMLCSKWQFQLGMKTSFVILAGQVSTWHQQASTPLSWEIQDPWMSLFGITEIFLNARLFL